VEDLISKIDIQQYAPGAIGWATNILLAIAILVIGYWIAGRVGRGIQKLASRYPKLDQTLFNFLGTLAKYIILAFVFIAVLDRFGVETTSIVALLGAAGLAVGLALQGAMSNLAAGVMLLIFRPYKVGDFIDAAGKFGNVTEIDMFTTILQTFDNQQIIIPNGKIWGEQIINHSHHDVRGVDMRFKVAGNADLSKTRKIVETVLGSHPHILKTPAPFVEVESLADGAVEFLMRPFCNGAHYFVVLYSVPEQIKSALDAGGVEIPVPYRKIIMVNETV